jgi:hypothetical protein
MEKYTVIITTGKPGEIPVIVRNNETGVETKYYLYIQLPWYVTDVERHYGIDEHGVYLTDPEIIQAIEDDNLRWMGLKRIDK